MFNGGVKLGNIYPTMSKDNLYKITKNIDCITVYPPTYSDEYVFII